MRVPRVSTPSSSLFSGSKTGKPPLEITMEEIESDLKFSESPPQFGQHLSITLFPRTPQLPSTWGTVSLRSRSNSVSTRKRKQSPDASYQKDSIDSDSSVFIIEPKTLTTVKAEFSDTTDAIFTSVRNGFEGGFSSTFGMDPSPTSSQVQTKPSPSLPSINNFFGGPSQSQRNPSPSHLNLQSILKKYPTSVMNKVDLPVFSGPPSTLAQKPKPHLSSISPGNKSGSTNIIVPNKPKLTISGRLRASIKSEGESPSSSLSEQQIPSPLSLPESGIVGSSVPIVLTSPAITCIPPALQIASVPMNCPGPLRLTLRIKRPFGVDGDSDASGKVADEIRYERIEAVSVHKNRSPEKSTTTIPVDNFRQEAPRKMSPTPRKMRGRKAASILRFAEPPILMTESRDREMVMDLTSPNSILAIACLEKLNFREKFAQLPAAVQYELMAMLPETMTTVETDGRKILKAGILSPSDAKFKQSLLEWQANLHRGEFDTEVRRKYIETELAEIDPWKLENFETVYGEIMDGKRPTRVKSDPDNACSSRLTK